MGGGSGKKDEGEKRVEKWEKGGLERQRGAGVEVMLGEGREEQEQGEEEQA